MVVLAEEMGSGMIIAGLSWYSSETEPVVGIRHDVEIHMGFCAIDNLGSDFQANYIPGTRTLVFQADSLALEAEPGEAFGIELQVPFACDGSQNLLIEISHTPEYGNEGIDCWNWEADQGRMVYSTSLTGPGIVCDEVPCMIISSPAGLAPATFGSIKTVFTAP